MFLYIILHALIFTTVLINIIVSAQYLMDLPHSPKVKDIGVFLLMLVFAFPVFILFVTLNPLLLLGK